MASRYDPAVCSGRYAGEPRWPMMIGRPVVCRRAPPRAWATCAPPERPNAAAPATPRLSIDLREKPGIAIPLSRRFVSADRTSAGGTRVPAGMGLTRSVLTGDRPRGQTPDRPSVNVTLIPGEEPPGYGASFVVKPPAPIDKPPPPCGRPPA